jgi:K+-transporting ATPase ATPase A chain
VLAFSAVSIVFLYALLRLQHDFGHPYAVPQMTSGQAWNTAVSFVTNTNWQSYSGESALGYIAQMAGLAVQNFASAAVGVAVAIALVRGFARSQTDRVGNFWVDLTRICLRVLLPIAVVFAIVFVGAGMIQNFHDYHTITTIAGGQQTLPESPVASQEVIKELGTNGGGFFNANSSHPFENPTTWTNWLEIFLLLGISFSLPRTFGVMVGDRRQGRAIVTVMAVLAVTSVVLITVFQAAHPRHGSDCGWCECRGHGDAIRDSGLGGVRRRHDAHVDRRGGQLPRQLHEPGRRDDATEHDAG